MNNWELSEKDLKRLICARGITTYDANHIVKLINLKKGNRYQLDKSPILPYDNLSKMKKIYLKKMKKIYEKYSIDFMNYIIDLKNTDIFKIETNEFTTINNMEEIIDVVLEIYSYYSKKLYFIAKKIFMDKSFLIVDDMKYHPIWYI